MQAAQQSPTTVLVAAAASLLWYCIVASVCLTGHIQTWRYYSSSPKPVDAKDEEQLPHVTVIRPAKGIEPYMYECLASAFRQTYPRHKIHIRLCVSERDDQGLPVLRRLLHDFPGIDAQILIEDEDPMLEQNRHVLGPNPKIRNMSRAYREAPSDIVWVLDCNVWVAKYTLARMASRLERDPKTKLKNRYVHQLPLVVDTVGTTANEETQGISDQTPKGMLDGTKLRRDDRTLWNIGGGRLEEAYMSTMHPKFYAAINTVGVAACVLGKSTMFRRSHLGALTNGRGIDHFSENICEDQLLGILLWGGRLPEEDRGERLARNALCFGDVAIQPMSSISIGEYCRRRVRWLRVRKYTVTSATFVEPGTECFVCSLYGAFAVTTLPFFQNYLGIPPTWLSFALFWLVGSLIWFGMDYMLYQTLQSAAAVTVDENTPEFARPPPKGRRHPFHERLLAWLGREILACPLWVWAFWGGATMEWRGRKFWVGFDMKVHEIIAERPREHGNGHLRSANGKHRVE